MLRVAVATAVKLKRSVTQSAAELAMALRQLGPSLLPVILLILEGSQLRNKSVNVSTASPHADGGLILELDRYTDCGDPAAAQRRGPRAAAMNMFVTNLHMNANGSSPPFHYTTIIFVFTAVSVATWRIGCLIQRQVGTFAK